MHEYRMTRQEVIFELPLAAGLALYEAIRARHGMDDGNGYVDRMARKAANEMKRYLQENYQII